jgi:hypothetical protein
MKPQAYDVELMLNGTDVTLTFNRVMGMTLQDAVTFAYGMVSAPLAWSLATVKLSDEPRLCTKKLA